MNDGTSDSAIATVSLTVTSVNDAPTASDATAVTAEDTTVAGTLSASDIEGSTVTFSRVTGPAHGSLVLNTDGTYAYSPAANYFGPDSFSYKVNNGTTDSAVATVSLTVTSVNDAPTAGDATAVTAEDTAVAGTLSASDIEGSTLTFSTVTGPAHGTLVLNTDGTYTYTPAANYFGADSFTYKVNDGTTDSPVATVNLTVKQASISPVVVGSMTRPIAPQSDDVETTSVAPSESGVPAGPQVQVPAPTSTNTPTLTTTPPVGDWRTIPGAPSIVVEPTAPPAAGGAPVSDALAEAAGSLGRGTLRSRAPAPDDVLPALASGLGLPATDMLLAADASGGRQAITDALNALSATAAAESTPAMAALAQPDTGFPVARLTSPQSGESGGVLASMPLAGEDRLFVYQGIQDPRSSSATSLVYDVSPDAFGHTNPKAVVSLEATLPDGSPLPGWIQFDTRTGMLRGTPPDRAATDIDIKITARDDAGREAYVVFHPIFDAGSPILATGPAGGVVADDAAADLNALALNTPAPVDGLGLKVARAAQDASPMGLRTADAVSDFATSAFVAEGARLGEGKLPPAQGYPVVRVDSSDRILVATGGVEAEQGLFVYRGFADQTFAAGRTLDFHVPYDAFGHTDPHAIVILEARLVDGSPLPPWLSFNSLRGTFTGTPPTGLGDSIEIEIVAKDDEGHIARIQFTLKLDAIIVETDAAPQWEQAGTEATRGGPDADEISTVDATGAETGTPARNKVGAKAAPQLDKLEKHGAVSFTEQVRSARMARDPVLARIVAAERGATTKN